MFCAAVFQTTCTTHGIRAIPAKRCCWATYSEVAFSIDDRAAAYSGEVESSLRCTSITPHCRLLGVSVRPSAPLIPAPPAPAPPPIPAPPAWPPPLIPAPPPAPPPLIPVPPPLPPPLIPPGMVPDPPAPGAPLPVIDIRPPGIPFAAGVPLLDGPAAGASPGIRWSSSRCLPALPLAFLGISPPSSGGNEQVGTNPVPDRQGFPQATPRSKAVPPAFPHRTASPQVTALRSPSTHHPGRTSLRTQAVNFPRTSFPC